MEDVTTRTITLNAGDIKAILAAKFGIDVEATGMDWSEAPRQLTLVVDITPELTAARQNR